MTDTTADLFYPVVSYGVRLRDQLDRGESPDFDKEQTELLSLLQSREEAKRSADYMGDGNFLGIRYALACWLDEIFIGELTSEWAKRWDNRKLETAIFNTNERYSKFWDQANRARVRAGTDALEGYFLCVMLGFRGRALDEPDLLATWTEGARRQISNSENLAWPKPPEITPVQRVPPRHGRDRMRKMVLIGSVSLLSLMVAIIISLGLSR
jgi:type VI secretion system protein ImpK